MVFSDMIPQDTAVTISILMSVYNGQKTLGKAVESILTQTYSDYEFIICDDASTDDSWNILQAYQRRDPRIHIFRNARNLGLGASLNRCLQRAHGRYVARQDADDISAPERIERTLDYLKMHQLPYAGCGIYVFDDTGVWGQRCFPERINKHIVAQKNPFFHPTMMFQREVLEAVNGYCEDEVARRTEDYDLVMRLAAEGIIGQNLQEYLYYVYEPPEAYLRHTVATRLNEIRVRLGGLKRMNAPVWDYIYLFKPMIMLLIPRAAIHKLKQLQWGRTERK